MGFEAEVFRIDFRGIAAVNFAFLCSFSFKLAFEILADFDDMIERKPGTVVESENKLLRPNNSRSAGSYLLLLGSKAFGK